MQRVAASPWRKELNDLARATSGAFLFGMPLLFTMEMWWIGSFTDSPKLLFILALTVAINVMLAYFEGFRRARSLGDAAAQAVEAVAIGALASTLVLAVLNRIAFGDPLDSILGKIIVLAMPLSLGASVANALLRSRDNNASGGEERSQSKGRASSTEQGQGDTLKATLVDIGTTIGGALFIGFAIAPTEEIPMLSAEMDLGHEIALVALALLISYVIVFQSGFSRESGEDLRGPFQRPITETVLSYVVALLVSAGSLLLFDQMTFGDPFPDLVSKTLVLGLPSAIGGAAGRLLI